MIWTDAVDDEPGLLSQAIEFGGVQLDCQSVYWKVNRDEVVEIYFQ